MLTSKSSRLYADCFCFALPFTLRLGFAVNDAFIPLSYIALTSSRTLSAILAMYSLLVGLVLPDWAE